MSTGQKYAALYDLKSPDCHNAEVNPALLEYSHFLGPPHNPDPDNKAAPSSSSPSRVFIPNCGKSLDVPYLLQLGHRIFGIEAVQQTIEELNQENNLSMEYDQEQSVYYTEDKSLIVYHGDFFKCPVQNWGPFQAVWDRASFGAINFNQRSKYIDVITRAIDTDSFRYLLEGYEYDRNLEKSDKPRPFAVTPDDVEVYFGVWGAVKVLQSEPVEEDFLSSHPEFTRQNCNRNIYFIENL